MGHKQPKSPSFQGLKEYDIQKNAAFHNACDYPIEVSLSWSAELFLLGTPSRDLPFLAWQGYFYLYTVQM